MPLILTTSLIKEMVRSNLDQGSAVFQLGISIIILKVIPDMLSLRLNTSIIIDLAIIVLKMSRDFHSVSTTVVQVH